MTLPHQQHVHLHIHKNKTIAALQCMWHLHPICFMTLKQCEGPTNFFSQNSACNSYEPLLFFSYCLFRQNRN